MGLTPQTTRPDSAGSRVCRPSGPPAWQLRPGPLILQASVSRGGGPIVRGGGGAALGEVAGRKCTSPDFSPAAPALFRGIKLQRRADLTCG